MTIVVDTSIVVDHLRGHPAARDALAAALDDGVPPVGSVLTKVEVLAGMRSGEEAATRRIFEVLEWAPVDDAIAEGAGALANRYLRSHPGVDPVDFVIAATVEAYDAVLWTRNVKHFPMLDGLAPPY